MYVRWAERERKNEERRILRRSNERVSIKPRRSFNYPRHRNEEALIYRRVDDIRAYDTYICTTIRESIRTLSIPCYVEPRWERTIWLHDFIDEIWNQSENVGRSHGIFIYVCLAKRWYLVYNYFKWMLQ